MSHESPLRSDILSTYQHQSVQSLYCLSVLNLIQKPIDFLLKSLIRSLWALLGPHFVWLERSNFVLSSLHTSYFVTQHSFARLGVS